MTFLTRTLPSHGRFLAIGFGLLVLAYIAWKIGQSPVQALQFTFNGLAVGAIYALLAMGFTFAYSTVWFFDLYYGAAATIGAYGVFYLRSSDALYSRYDVNNVVINIALAAAVAGVAAWALHLVLAPRLGAHLKPVTVRLVIGCASHGIALAAAVAGVAAWRSALVRLVIGRAVWCVGIGV